MKSLAILWTHLADELAGWCSTSATQDSKTVLSRTEHEGVSFLAITLPTFAKGFERSLEQGKWDSPSFTAFTVAKGCLPAFLSGFTSQVFDPVSGALLDKPCIDSIFAVRQLTMLYGKILLECTKKRQGDAMRGYVELEEDLDRVERTIVEDQWSRFRRISTLLWSDVFSFVAQKAFDGDLIPKHGPGSTADRLTGNRKYEQAEWTERLNSVLPWEEFLPVSGRYVRELSQFIEILELEAERPVRVISVPKTLKTPRIIAIEPTCVQYMQQAILDPLVEGLESKRIIGCDRPNLAFGFVGFADQDPNREMARRGSLFGDHATLDMSEASDRVLNRHVTELCHLNRLLSEVVQATRSVKADVPGYGVIPLSKFASMGSALCFPFEAMVFTTIIFVAIELRAKAPLTREDIMSFRGKVRVYGDDIIVPSDYAELVADTLELYGLKVNYGKSYWNGKFRESCGGDYYDGVDVTPVRFRRLFPATLNDGPEVISLIEFRNHLYERGLWRTSALLDERIRRLTHGNFPIVEKTSPLKGRFSFLAYQPERVNANNTPLVRGIRVVAQSPSDPLDGHGALLKCLLMLERSEDDGFLSIISPKPVSEHLARQGRPRSVRTKIGWCTPF
jgi:hypothetical protein